MTVKRSDKLVTIKPTENSISEFFLAFKEKYSNFRSENIILDFSDFKGVKTENIFVILQIVQSHRNNGMSFVMVSNEIDADDLPNEELIVVPTLTEAKDIIEMEEIERDLGF